MAQSFNDAVKSASNGQSTTSDVNNTAPSTTDNGVTWHGVQSMDAQYSPSAVQSNRMSGWEIATIALVGVILLVVLVLIGRRVLRRVVTGQASKRV